MRVNENLINRLGKLVRILIGARLFKSRGLGFDSIMRLWQGTIDHKKCIYSSIIHFLTYNCRFMHVSMKPI